MYNIHDSTVYLYFFIILANKVACLLAQGDVKGKYSKDPTETMTLPKNPYKGANSLA